LVISDQDQINLVDPIGLDIGARRTTTNPIGSVGRSSFLRRGECGSRDDLGATTVASGPAVLSPAEPHPVPPARSTDQWQVPVQSESCPGPSLRYCPARQDRGPSSPGPTLTRCSRSAWRSSARKVCYPHTPPARVPRPTPGEVTGPGLRVWCPRGEQGPPRLRNAERRSRFSSGGWSLLGVKATFLGEARGCAASRTVYPPIGLPTPIA
jgi:hypothetical protein